MVGYEFQPNYQTLEIMTGDSELDYAASEKKNRDMIVYFLELLSFEVAR